MKKRTLLTLMSALGIPAIGAFITSASVSAYSTTEFTLNSTPNPTISISMDQPIVGDNNLEQVEGLPSSTSFYKPININVKDTKSYYVSVYLDCSALTGENKTKCEAGNLITSSGDTLASVSSAKTFSTMSNEWGFRYNMGDSAQDPSDKYFAPLPTDKSSGYLQFDGVERIKTPDGASDNKTLTLSFGAKVNGNTAAGTYNGKIAVAIVATPAELVFNGITTMQAMNHDICAAASVHDTAYLKDIRDNRYYWVTKLEDEHCWMSQNLDLGIAVINGNNASNNTSTILSSSNTDMTSGNVTGLKPTTNNIALEGADVETGDMSKNSWEQGLYVYNDPAAEKFCSSSVGNKGVSGCTATFTNVSGSEWKVAKDPNFTNLTTYQQDGVTYNKTAGSPLDEESHIYDAHYLVGNYYQFNAATISSATNGDTNLTNIDAPDSLCPAGWKMPSANTMEDVAGRSSFGYMLSKYGIATAANAGRFEGTDLTGKSTNITLNPLFYVRGGFINPSGKYLSFAGSWGLIWSAHTQGDPIYAHGVQFSNNGFTASDGRNRYMGLPIRCLVY